MILIACSVSGQVIREKQIEQQDTILHLWCFWDDMEK